MKDCGRAKLCGFESVCSCEPEIVVVEPDIVEGLSTQSLFSSQKNKSLLRPKILGHGRCPVTQVTTAKTRSLLKPVIVPEKGEALK